MAKINIDNFEINYLYEDGKDNKPLVLFFHGFGDSYQTFNPILRMQRHFRFCGFDFPGCGLSSFKSDLLLEDYYKVALKFINQVLSEEKQIYIVSHSLGAASALFVNSLPQIKATLLLSPFNEFLTFDKDNLSLPNWLIPSNTQECVESYENLFASSNERLNKVANFTCMRRNSSFEFHKRKFEKMVVNQITNEEYLNNTLAQMYANASNIYILSGDKDNYTTEMEMEQIKRKYFFDTEILSNVGHAIIFESPEAVLNKINQIIKEN